MCVSVCVSGHLDGGKGGGGAQSRIPLFSPTFWNSYPAYQKNPISNPPYPISFPNLQIPHTKKFNDKSCIPKIMKDKSFFRVFYLAKCNYCREKAYLRYGYQYVFLNQYSVRMTSDKTGKYKVFYPVCLLKLAF